MFVKLDRLLGQIEGVISGSLLLIMTALIFANIVLRFFTGKTITWAEDISVFFMIIMTFFAAAYGTRLNRHISMSALYDIMSGKVRQVFYFLGLLVPAVLTVFLCIMGWQVTRTIYDMRGMIASMNLPKYWPYLIVSIAVLFMAMHFLHLLARFLTSYQVDDALEREE
ncbi:MAG: TRAP transporter small permease [Candidatus Tectomicrobia bacterium]